MATKEKIETCEELEAKLAWFTGTTSWYRFAFNRNCSYTDGVREMAELAGAYWLINVVDSYSPDIMKNPKLADFAIVRLTVNEDRSALFEVLADTGKKPAITQEIPATDFPQGVFEMYFEGGVLLLKTEH